MSAPEPGSVVLSPTDVEYLRARVAEAINGSLPGELRREAAWKIVGRLELLLPGGESS